MGIHRYKQTPLRFTDKDVERIAELKRRYRLESTTDAVRLALVLALKQNVLYGAAKIREMLG
jgi:hypothetical protein